MPYMKETCVAGRTIEVRKYYNFHVPPPGERREPSGKSTPERIQKANRRKAETDLRRLMNANFEAFKGYSLTFTYDSEHIPESIPDARRDAARYFRKLQGIARKNGEILKFIYCIGAGTRGRIHIHAVVSGVSQDEQDECWKKGYIDRKPLHTEEFSDLAAYYIQNAETTKALETEQGLKPGRRYNSSHNLIKPKVIKERILAKEFRKEPRTRKGYQIVKDLTRSGISDLTGMPYLAYTLLKDKEYAGNQPIHSDRSKRKHARSRARGIRAGDDTEERLKGAP
ncbi:MAG: hypothetical protein IJU87_04685 [Lachnospiraceae bacterium]|nr:hypothetical protein [Lachnospiraceae bacterium]